MDQAPIHRLKLEEIKRVLEFAAIREWEGQSETPVRNWMIASIIAELVVSREVAHQYGITDKIEQELERSALVPDAFAKPRREAE